MVEKKEKDLPKNNKNLTGSIIAGVIVGSLIAGSIATGGYMYIQQIEVQNKEKAAADRKKVEGLEKEVAGIKKQSDKLVSLEKKVIEHEIRLAEVQQITGTLHKYVALLDFNNDGKLDRIISTTSGNFIVQIQGKNGEYTSRTYSTDSMKRLTDDYFFGTENLVSNQTSELVLKMHPEAYCSIKKLAIETRFWTQQNNDYYDKASQRIENFYPEKIKCVYKEEA